MSIFGGGGGKDKVAKPPKGMMENPKPVYHGNPQNMPPGMRQVWDTPYVPKEPSLISSPKTKKNSLISRGRM